MHKLSWQSTDGNTLNEIDYICSCAGWRSLLLDVKVHRGADVGSDHHLSVAKFLTKLKRFTKTEKALKIMVVKLQGGNTAEFFRQNLSYCFAVLEEDLGLEEKWELFKKGINQSAIEEVGH